METVNRDIQVRAAADPELVGLTPEDVVDSLDEIYYFVTMDGKFVQWNSTLTDITGLTNEEIRDMKVLELFMEDERENVKKQIGRTVIQKEPRNFEATLICENGDQIPYEFSAKPVTNNSGSCHGVIGIGRDISERKKRERRLNKVLSNSPVYLFAVDSTGVLQLSRGEILQRLGLSEGAGVGHKVTNIYDSKEFIDIIECACNGETIQDTVELQNITLDVVCEPLINGGEVERVVGVGYDVSELKEYESQIETQRDQLQLLNHVVRHDIRNNIQVIQAYLDLIASDISDENKEHLSTIQENIKSALGLTVTAKELSEVMINSDEENITDVHLPSVLMDVVETVNSRFSEAVINTPDDFPIHNVNGHDLLDSVFRNILINAVLHNDKETPEIDLDVTEKQQSVVVTIADNGPGVNDKHKETIFAKEEKDMKSSGSGIGLYLVQLIVDRCGGDVWVTDNTPEGAIFHVELPQPPQY